MDTLESGPAYLSWFHFSRGGPLRGSVLGTHPQRVKSSFICFSLLQMLSVIKNVGRETSRQKTGLLVNRVFQAQEIIHL